LHAAAPADEALETLICKAWDIGCTRRALADQREWLPLCLKGLSLTPHHANRAFYQRFSRLVAPEFPAVLRAVTCVAARQLDHSSVLAAMPATRLAKPASEGVDE